MKPLTDREKKTIVKHTEAALTGSLEDWINQYCGKTQTDRQLVRLTVGMNLMQHGGTMMASEYGIPLARMRKAVSNFLDTVTLLANEAEEERRNDGR